MASTFENNLRLEEIGTGEQSGTWGTKTNVNLELITDGLSYSSTGEAIANASTHTITMADGVADEFRSFYLKCTGGGQACTVTLAPNTLSKVWVIENTTSYTLTFSQGSGANVAILAGQVKMIATDGAGSGAAVFDLMQDLAVPDLFVDDDLTLQSDGAILNFGADSDINLTHTADTSLTLGGAGSTTGLLINNTATDGDPFLAFALSGTQVFTMGVDDGDGDKFKIGTTAIGTNTRLTIDSSGNATFSGSITSGSNIVSDTDSTDDLGTTSVRWANLFVDAITATDQVTATGFTGTLDGILGSGSAAAATVTTLDTSGVVNLNLVTDSTSSTSGALIVDGGVGIAKKLFVGTDLDVEGTTNLDAVDIDGAVQIDSTVTVGVDDTGYDVKFFGATSGKSLLWDESADSLIVTGTTTLVGTTNLDVVDIDGAVQLDSTLTVGVDDTGYDVKFFGASASHFLLWDESADELVLAADSKLSFNDAAGGENIVASADGHLEVNAGTTLDVTAPTVQINASSVFDVNGNIDVSGTYTGGGLMTTGGNIVIPNAGNIGSAGDTDAIAIASDGQVTLTQTLTGTAANFSGVATATTFEPDGDTAAGDNAAIGYTSAEGLILTGQGSTSDITFKNDADTTVFSIPTGTDDVLFPDNAKIIMGAGSDLQIYHSTVDAASIITDQGTGPLAIQSNLILLQNSGGTANLIKATEGGAAELLHSNATKIATSATGVDVTGNAVLATADSYLYSNGTSGGTTIDAGFRFETSTPKLEFWVNDGERASVSATGLVLGGAGGNSTGIIQGSSGSGSTNQPGTDLQLKGGAGGGTGGSNIKFFTAPGGSSGTSESAAVERMKIDNNGNVRIYSSAANVGRLGLAVDGTTLASVNDSTGVAVVQLGQASFLTQFDFDGVGSVHLANNVYYNGTNLIAPFAGAASDYYQSGGGHYFRSRTSGSAGSMSLATNMVLDVDGNLGINQPSPVSKLNVTSTAHDNGPVFESTGTTQLWLRDTDVGTDSQRNWGFQSSGGTLNIVRANNDRASGFVTPVYIEQAPANSLIINSSGHVLFGKSADDNTTVGTVIHDNGFVSIARENNISMILNRSNVGEILRLTVAGQERGSLHINNDRMLIDSEGDASGLRFDAASYTPFKDGSVANGTVDLGYANGRFNDVFAVNSTIQTSDQNEKQDIAELTATEMKVGKRISTLFKTFKFKSKVTTKGDAARTHTGIIAQDVQAAFSAEGLDASKYALWCSNTWTNDDGSEQTRMGIRYPELLSFLSSYNEQRFTDIEARITALEGV